MSWKEIIKDSEYDSPYWESKRLDPTYRSYYEAFLGSDSPQNERSFHAAMFYAKLNLLKVSDDDKYDEAQRLLEDIQKVFRLMDKLEDLSLSLQRELPEVIQ